jgi:hypothetical protein
MSLAEAHHQALFTGSFAELLLRRINAFRAWHSLSMTSS